MSDNKKPPQQKRINESTQIPPSIGNNTPARSKYGSLEWVDKRNSTTVNFNPAPPAPPRPPKSK